MCTDTPTRRPRLNREANLRTGQSRRARVESRIRAMARLACGLFSHPPPDREWIMFLFYHWVLDDQQPAFRKQLGFLQRNGDFISLDDAITALGSEGGIGGRYFCVTFDDGLRNLFTNALPVLSAMRVPAAVFLVTQYVGLDLDKDWETIAPFYQRSWTRQQSYFEFLTWDECRQMAAAGITIGSHTHSHARLNLLAAADVEKELKLSKETIESQLGVPCRHFACPWGTPSQDFDPKVHPEMARDLGYRSFLTTEPGLHSRADSPFLIRRIGITPDLAPLELRYCLFPSWCRSLHQRPP